MKLAIIGSRDFVEYEFLKSSIQSLFRIEDISEIVSGGARGADKLGGAFAKEFNIPTKIFFPNWDKHGKAAGMIRNNDIIQYADVIVAFWNGKSRGTLDSINKARKAKKQIHIVRYNEDIQGIFD